MLQQNRGEKQDCATLDVANTTLSVVRHNTTINTYPGVQTYSTPGVE